MNEQDKNLRMEKKLNKIEISNSSGKQLKVTVVKMLIGRRMEEHSKNFK